jgi:hypothetical protein
MPECRLLPALLFLLFILLTVCAYERNRAPKLFVCCMRCTYIHCTICSWRFCVARFLIGINLAPSPGDSNQLWQLQYGKGQNQIRSMTSLGVCKGPVDPFVNEGPTFVSCAIGVCQPLLHMCTEPALLNLILRSVNQLKSANDGDFALISYEAEIPKLDLG